jgi:hypothetical protein
MAELKGKAGRFLVRAEIVIGFAALLWAAIGLFWPSAVTKLAGSLDSGQAYTTTYTTSAYNTVGGYLTLLAAAVCLTAGIQLFRGDRRAKSLFWPLFVLSLLGAELFAGATRVISWLPGIPAEIQHGIGTEYVKVVENAVLNVPMEISKALIAVWLGLAVAAYLVGRRRSAS